MCVIRSRLFGLIVFEWKTHYDRTIWIGQSSRAPESIIIKTKSSTIENTVSVVVYIIMTTCTKVSTGHTQVFSCCVDLPISILLFTPGYKSLRKKSELERSNMVVRKKNFALSLSLSLPLRANLVTHVQCWMLMWWEAKITITFRLLSKSHTHKKQSTAEEQRKRVSERERRRDYNYTNNSNDKTWFKLIFYAL